MERIFSPCVVGVGVAGAVGEPGAALAPTPDSMGSIAA